jgi:hypothetical protein
MQITFKMAIIAEPITVEELNEFQTLIGMILPEDYRQHMLTYNGGIVNEYDNAHISDPEGGGGIAKFHPIKYGGYTMEKSYQYTHDILPTGYLAIGRPRGGGEIIISLNNDTSYGNTKHWYEDGTIYDLSPSFTQLINDQVEQIG